jgi:predicted DNA-binding protein (MmcQ/YjbR family)
MNIEHFRDACLSLPYTEETLPFDDQTLVYKVGNKMYALIGMDKPNACNLKCNPAYAIELRANFVGISPGFHMNKNHWNTIKFNEDVGDQLILELLTHSYQLVWDKLPKKVKATYSRGAF